MPSQEPSTSGRKGRFWNLVRQFETTLIETALAESGGNVSAAARSLEIDRVVLVRKIQALGLKAKKLPPGRPPTK